MADKDVHVDFTGDPDDLNRAIAETDAALQDLAASIKESLGEAEDSWDSFEDSVSDGAQVGGSELNNLGSALGSSGKSFKMWSVVAIGAIGAVVAAAGAVVGIVAGLHLLHAENEKEERLQAKLAAAIEMTGGKAGYTREQMNQLADQFEDMTGISSQLHKNVLAVIGSFQNVRGDNFKQAAELAHDMADVLGKEVPEMAKLLGEALDQPVEGLQKLKEAGVRFSDEQKNLIFSLLEQNKVMEAQQVILDQLHESFAGAATGELGEYGGALARLREKAWNIVELLAEKFVPVLDMLAPLLNKAANFVENVFGGAVESSIEPVKSFVFWIGDKVKAAFETMVHIGIFTFTRLEFAIKNWQEVVALSFAQFQLDVIKTFENAKHFLTVVIPDSLKWFADNWAEIFTDLGSFLATVFTNMWTNVANFFKGVWGMLQGKGLGDFKWVALTEGFEATLDELPQIAERKKGALEQALEKSITSSRKRLESEFDALLEERLAGFYGLFENKNDPTAPEATPDTENFDAIRGLPPSEKPKEVVKEAVKEGVKAASKETAAAEKEEEKVSGAFESFDAISKRIADAAMQERESDSEKITNLVTEAIDNTTSTIGDAIEATSKATNDIAMTLVDRIGEGFRVLQGAVDRQTNIVSDEKKAMDEGNRLFRDFTRAIAGVGALK